MSYNVFPQLTGITWNLKKRPTWNTTKMLTAGGNEFRTGYRQNPLTEFDLSYSYLSPTDKLSMEGFFNGQNGALTPFYFDLGVATNTPSDNSVTAFTFGIGDGTTTAFTLIKSAGTGAVEPIGGVNGAPLIYKSDWQGNQLQYATPRTNLVSNGNTPGGTGWTTVFNGTGTAPTITLNYATGPDGTSGAATRLQANQGAGSTVNDYSFLQSPSYTVVNGKTYIHSVWLKSNTGSNQPVYMAHAGLGAIAVTVTPAWSRFESLYTATANGTLAAYIGTRGTICPANNSLDILVAYEMVEVAQAGLNTPTSYIPTTTSAVTVTDYTLTGNQVAFAAAPLLNAVMTWTGNFYYLVRFSEDVLEFNQLMNQMYELQECKLVSVQ